MGGLKHFQEIFIFLCGCNCCKRLSCLLTLDIAGQDVPDKVPQLVVLDYSSRSANLSWVAPADNQSPITRYTILYKPYRSPSWHSAGKEQVYGSVSQASLNGLQPNTVYTIKIRRVNRKYFFQTKIKHVPLCEEY